LILLENQQFATQDFEGFSRHRIYFRIPPGTPGAGVIVIPAPNPDRTDIILMLPPQVGVRFQGETEYRYYTIEDLERGGVELLQLQPRAKSSIRLLAASDDDAGLERIRSTVHALLPKFREEGPLDLPPPERVEGKILVEIKAKVDTSIARAIAKIAFNYMTKEAGVKFALDASFDPLREFIRHGEGGNNWRQFVRIVSKPLLAEETEDLQVTRGHVLIFGWHDFDTLETYVSPYNSMTYRVTLTRSHRGIWQPLQRGHVFDWEHRKVMAFTPVSRILLPPGSAQRAALAYQALVRRPSE
ncbi:MAG: hypothetical protein ACLQDV_17120, partial [Candidatus Binataceae bacterium]